MRVIDLDLWTMVAWRSLFAFVSLSIAALLLVGRKAFRFRRSIGWPGLVYIPIATMSMITYIAALRLTTVANVMTIYATLPFLAAGIAYLLMRERVDRQVMIASGVGFLGVLVMAGFATRPADIAGNAMALVMTASFAATVVMARRWPTLDLTMVTALAAALCGAVCFMLASSVLPSPSQLGLLLPVQPGDTEPQLRPVSRGRTPYPLGGGGPCGIARRRPRALVGLACVRRAAEHRRPHRRRPDDVSRAAVSDAAAGTEQSVALQSIERGNSSRDFVGRLQS